jgi:hypothetical protein
MLSKEILLMSKKLYQKIKQIVPEWLRQIMVDVVAVEAVAKVVCVDHHQEQLGDGDLWVVNRILVEVPVIDLVVVVVAAVAVAMELVEIMAVDRHLTAVVMVVIWVEEVTVVV